MLDQGSLASLLLVFLTDGTLIGTVREVLRKYATLAVVAKPHTSENSNRPHINLIKISMLIDPPLNGLWPSPLL